MMSESINKGLNDPLILLFFNFLDWVLPKFVNLNKLFQNERSIIAILHTKMIETYKGFNNLFF